MISALRRALGWTTGATTGDQNAATLAAYSSACARASEAEREKRRLRKLVDEIPEGVHGGWRKRFGEPAEVVDKDAVEELLTKHGLPVPKKAAAAPVVVEYVGRGEGA